MSSSRTPRARIVSFSYSARYADEAYSYRMSNSARTTSARGEPISERTQMAEYMPETDPEYQAYRLEDDDKVIEPSSEYKQRVKFLRFATIIPLAITIVATIAMCYAGIDYASTYSIMVGTAGYIIVVFSQAVALELKAFYDYVSPISGRLKMKKIKDINPKLYSTFRCKCSKRKGFVFRVNESGNWFDLAPLVEIMPRSPDHASEFGSEFILVNMKHMITTLGYEDNQFIKTLKDRYLRGHPAACRESFKSKMRLSDWPYDAFLVIRETNDSLDSYRNWMFLSCLVFASSFMYARFHRKHVKEVTLTYNKVFTNNSTSAATEEFPFLAAPRDTIAL